MDEKIKKLLDMLDAYIKDEVTISEIEDYTLELISQEDFDKFQEEVQNKIYELNMWELNQLGKEDIEEMQHELKILIII